MKQPPPVKTIDRLVRILDSFSPEKTTWSLSELSAHLGLPKSTLHRFLISLESHSILRREPADMRWRLGYHLFHWGNLAAQSTGLRDIAAPVMRDLVAVTHETAILTVLHDKEVICIEKAETSHPVRLALEVGSRRPPHAGASSKVLMAYLSEKDVQDIIREKGLPKLCTNTITDVKQLRIELSAIREQQYAESYEETDQNAWGVATPVFDRNRAVIAAIGIAGPSTRYSTDLVHNYLDLCRQASERISLLMFTGTGN